ncbi:MAG: AAA family ATPase [Clostridia bacterium]|nr:AAA family ATPase [Clostridia bacterium]
MADINNSRLLEQLFERAKQIVVGNSALTEEKFVLAAMETVLRGADARDDEWSALKDAVTACFGGFEVLKRKCETLRESVTTHKTGFMDTLQMQKKIMEAKTAASRAGKDALEADELFRHVMQTPSSMLSALTSETGGELVKPVIPSPVKTTVDADPLPSDDGARGGKDASGSDGDTAVCEDAQESGILALTNRAKGLQATLSSAVYGQDNAVSIFVAGYFQAELLSMTDKARVRPAATFLFAGPPGVGKTFLAEQAATALGRPFMRFDMSEYASYDAPTALCGAGRMYQGSKAGLLTDFVKNNPKCVLLFDEVEKAHLNVIHLFLQMLDAGRLRDGHYDEEVFFRDAIIIFTTNAGRQLYENADDGDFSTVPRKVILRALQNDVGPMGNPFFPAALCSRFASGNVVMFNRISAPVLRDIARKEVLRHARNSATELSVSVEIDELVYTALLFAEGGTADARTVRSRAETFFDSEIFELYRMLTSKAVKQGQDQVKKIRISVQLPEGDAALRELFEQSEPSEILVFASEQTSSRLSLVSGNYRLICAGDVDEAAAILRKRDIKMAVIDPLYGRRNEAQDYLNIEDIDSKARDFFYHLREHHKELPTYLLQTEEREIGDEERVSFLRQGVRGVLALDSATLCAQIEDICAMIHQQASMRSLARANKLVTFETAQRLTEEPGTAEIRLFDFEMVVAVDSEDAGNILSNISKPNVRFDQVIGAADAKRELADFVDYLKNPKKYMTLGARTPRGILLYGPPGTGKTMLAKALASEADVTFITAEGNQFLKKYVGEGAEKVHELFRTARKYAPTILFIDEIDAIGRERVGGDSGRGTEETLTAFLTEMDGFSCDPKKPVFVMAATNFNVEPRTGKSLDPALVRRFDRHGYIDLPGRDDRVRYLKMKFDTNEAFDVSDEMLENLAIRSTGKSLADLESILELALRSMLRSGSRKVTDDILSEALETYCYGEKKMWSTDSLCRTARHEAGHAFLCWYSGETPSYLTVVSRGDFGGYMMHGDQEDKHILTRKDLLADIRTALGGRAAEIVYYGEEDGLSTGASADLRQATRCAKQMLTAYGMDQSFGLASFSEELGGVISERVYEKVNEILAREMEQAIEILRSHTDAVDAIVSRLMVKNHLGSAEIDRIFREHTQNPRNEK